MLHLRELQVFPCACCAYVVERERETLGEKRVVFENPERDQPRRFVYEREGDTEAAREARARVHELFVGDGPG